MVAGLGLIAGLSALIYLLVYCYRPASWGKSVVKTMSVAALAGASVVMLSPWWLTAAPCACALGDYLLALDRDKAFLGGVGAFALGHVFYIAGILAHPVSDPSRLLMAPQIWVVAGLAGLAVAMAIILFHRAGALRFAVLGYVPVIVGLGIVALTLPVGESFGFAVAGALLFVMSDFVLALDMFVLDRNGVVRKMTPFVIWSTYWAGQLLLLVGLANRIF